MRSELPIDSMPARVSVAVACDVDADGRVDLVGAGRQRYLVRNVSTGGAGFLDVELRAAAGRAVGALVRAHYSDGSVRAQRYGSAASSAFSQSLLPLHFGIPLGVELNEISVVWPGEATARRYTVGEPNVRMRIDR